jgi:hypothetical protein
LTNNASQQAPAACEMIEEVFSYENLFSDVKELMRKNKELEKVIEELKYDMNRLKTA